ncbi:MAG: hypothetical protein HPY75_07905 [Actinobacteria bacterium]|nr:hypothetical protein [Actinomycetota bacterium]
MSNRPVDLVVGPGPIEPSRGAWRKWHAARLCALLRRMGHRVIALEDDPSTLMDMGAAAEDLYVEPPLPEVVEAIVETRGVEHIWYGAGGRRAGELAARLSADGAHRRLGVKTPDWDDRAWWTCGDRSLMRETLEGAGMENPRCCAVRHPGEAQPAADRLGFPLVARAHFSEGARGTGLAYNREDFQGLVEEASRESLTGEFLVEEVLDGWTKYIVLVMRDALGGSLVAGILEQLSPACLHEGDAVLITPPGCAGGEAAYALSQMAMRVAEVLELAGICEVKIAVAPAWEAMCVVDVNPVARDVLVLMEVLLGRDLVLAQARLAMGERTAETGWGAGPARREACLVAVPARVAMGELDGVGYLSLARRSPGWKVITAESAPRAAAMALSQAEGIRRNKRGVGLDPRALESLMRIAAGKVVIHEKGAAPWAPSYLCVTRSTEGALEDGIMFTCGWGEKDGSGNERQALCIRALSAAKEMGRSAALYTSDPGLAMLAASEADACFLGELEAEWVAAAADELGMHTVTGIFGDGEAWTCARELEGLGVCVLEGREALLGDGGPADTLGRLGSAGLPVTDFLACELDEEAKVENMPFPLHGVRSDYPSRGSERLAYSSEEALRLARELGGGVLWRPVNEDAREVQVEAVGGPQGCVAALLWEQLDSAGISPGDGIAVYPTTTLTTESKKRALELARGALEVLGWRGNVSMRIVVEDTGMRIWGVEPGTSELTAFLERASGIPLVRLGLDALLGEENGIEEAACARVSVRVPLLPRGSIPGTDILPSGRRRAAGAVMGTARDYGEALGKALLSLGIRPPVGGTALLSVADREKRKAVLLARELAQLGFRIVATRGTAHTLAAAGIEVGTVRKLREGRPNVLDLIRNGEVSLVVNIPRGRHPHCDGYYIREASVRKGVPCVTDMEVAMALVLGLKRAVYPLPEPRALAEHTPAAGRAGGR